MKIAIINEVSSCAKNKDVVAAFSETGNEVINYGMTSPDASPTLTYIQTSLMSALVLNMGMADIVVGGCGTGQGYLNAVMKYPNICCVLITQPLDAWLAKRINAPNCISLALNQGYGWAGDINLKLIASHICENTPEKGYPPAREESQTESRKILNQISENNHKTMVEILQTLPEEIMKPVFLNSVFISETEHAAESELKRLVMTMIRKYQNG